MDHDIELIIPIPEILEIEISNILYNPGNLVNLSFPNFSHPGNLGNQLSPIYNMVEMRVAGGRLQGLCCAALDYFGTLFLEFRDMSNLRK